MSITYITYFVSLILFTTFVGVYFYNETFNKYTIFGTILIFVWYYNYIFKKN